jgi:hypothetical protein
MAVQELSIEQKERLRIGLRKAVKELKEIDEVGEHYAGFVKELASKLSMPEGKLKPAAIRIFKKDCENQ